jgi:putative endopeptidase
VRGRLALLLALLPACFAPPRSGAAPVLEAGPPRAFDPALLDRRADPCTDFWRFANGAWLDRHAVPADAGSFGVLDELQARDEQALRTILEQAAARTGAPQGSREQVLGDFWCACMDEPAAETRGLVPVSDLLGRINSIADRGDLRFFLSLVQLEGLPVITRVDVAADPEDATRLLPWLSPPALGLEDPGAYARGDAESAALREDYVGHIAAMLVLARRTPEQAAQEAGAAMELETALAASMRPVTGPRSGPGSEPRDEAALLDIDEADALCPGLPLSELMDRIGAPGRPRLALVEPDFSAELARLVDEAPLDSWRSWLRWRVMMLSAPMLSHDVEREQQRWRARLHGALPELPPRGERCLRAALKALSPELGQAFTECLPAASIEAARGLEQALRAALAARLASADWLSPPARLAAQARLDALLVHLGEPARGADTSTLAIGRTDHAANVQTIAAWRLRRELERLPRPAEPGAWPLSPLAADALYDPALHAVFLPASLLQPPFLDAQDEAASWGALGPLLAHEMLHAFDELQPAGAGEALAQRLDAELGLDQLHVDGRRTLVETLADLGGLRLALQAFTATRGAAPSLPDATGFTPEQRFFLASAQARRELLRPELLRWRLQQDAHAPPWLRVELAVHDLPEFGAAFGCAPAGPRLGLW